MKSGFFDNGTDVNDVYVTRDWLLSRYPDLSSNLLVNIQKRVGFAGSGYTGRSPYGISSGEQIAPGGTLNENVPSQFQWSGLARNGTVGITTNGSLWSWGTNVYGQVGDGTTINRSSPVQIAVNSLWKYIASSGLRSAAIDQSNVLYGWGGTSNAKIWSSTASPTWGSGGGAFLMIDNTGKLFGWGLNYSGQIGDNTITSKSSPVQIGTLNWSYVDTGQVYGHTLAIRSDGTLWGWGYNNYGSLGIYDSNNRSSPVQISTSSWIQVAVGGYFGGFSLAIRSDGTLWSWGQNSYGILGQGDNVNRSSPTQVGTSSWTSISAAKNSFSAMAIRSDGTLWVWGANSVGQLGQNDTVDRSSPVQVPGSWTAVYAGAYRSYALRSDGTAWSWGENFRGALGDGTASNRSSPVQIGTSSWVQLAAPNYSVLLRSASGNVYGYGDNAYKKLVIEDIPGSSWTKFGAGGHLNHAIKTDGTLWGWGYNAYGGIADGTKISRSSPVQIGTSSWIHVASKRSAQNDQSASWVHLTTAAVRADNTVWIWGRTIDTTSLATPLTYPLDSNLTYNAPSAPGTYSRPGSSFMRRSSPIQVASSVTASKVYPNGSGGYLILATDNKLYGGGFTGGYPGYPYVASLLGGVSVATTIYSWTQVSVTTAHALAIRSDGTLWAWGSNYSGQLGDPVAALAGQIIGYLPKSPIQIGTSSWTAVSAGPTGVSAAIRTDGALFTWGYNAQGQLGLGDATNRSSPVQVGTSSWTSISANGSGVAAIRSDGGLFIWGNNTEGQLGQNNVVARSSPVQVSAGTSWTQVSAATGFTMAIRNDGALFAWGYNGPGNLGLNDVNSRSTPVQVGTSSWSVVSTWGSGDVYVKTAAIRSDGRLFTWGRNDAGELGTNDVLRRSSPVNVGTESWTQVSMGRSHTVAIRSNNTMWEWGYSTYVGDYVATQAYSSPVQIGTSAWSKVSAGTNGRFAAIRSDGTLWTFADYGILTGYSQDTPTPDLEWGRDYSALTMVGNVPLPFLSSPVQIGSGTWNAVSMSEYGTVLAIRSDGTLWGWGYNSAGTLGDGIPVGGGDVKSSMVQIGTSSWTAVSAGYIHAAAIRSDGALFVWGGGSYGVIGDGTTASRSSPVQIGTSSWIAVAAGWYNTYAVRADGTLWAWGVGDYGVLGTNSITMRSSPVQVGSDTDWSSIDINYYLAPNLSSFGNVLAIKGAGKLTGWGYNTFGQVGDNTRAHRSSPVQVDAHAVVAVSSPVQIGAGTSWQGIYGNGGSDNYYLKSSNILYGVGYGQEGFFANSDLNHRSSPTVVGVGILPSPAVVTNTTDQWQRVDVSDNHSYAIKLDGTLWAWGTNTNGQVGNGTSNIVLTPQQIGTSYWSAVSAGYDHALAIRSDGTLWGWGLNDYGQIGDSTIVSRSSPVQIGTGTNWRAITAGSKASGALTTDNTMYVWGRNTYGQVGDGTTAHRSSPVQIGSSVWTKFIAFNRNDLQSSYAIDVVGNLFAWGEDTNNSLGVTSVAHRSSPVQVGTAGYASLDVISANNTGIGVYVVTDGGTLG